MRFFRPKTPHLITLYGKDGCHLCEDARELLRRLSRRHPMTVQEVDITADPTLFRRYDIRIPVVVIDDHTELEAPISEHDLRRALRRRS